MCYRVEQESLLKVITKKIRLPPVVEGIPVVVDPKIKMDINETLIFGWPYFNARQCVTEEYQLLMRIRTEKISLPALVEGIPVGVNSKINNYFREMVIFSRPCLNV